MMLRMGMLLCSNSLIQIILFSSLIQTLLFTCLLRYGSTALDEAVDGKAAGIANQLKQHALHHSNVLVKVSDSECALEQGSKQLPLHHSNALVKVSDSECAFEQ